jgi:hypothetical protein
MHARVVASAEPRVSFLRGLPEPAARMKHFRSAAQMFGGADRVRTDDPLLAKQVLSQLSYSPGSKGRSKKAEVRSDRGSKDPPSAFYFLPSALFGGPR